MSDAGDPGNKPQTITETNKALEKATSLLGIPKQAKGLPSLKPSPTKKEKPADWVRKQFKKIDATAGTEKADAEGPS